MTLVLPNIPPDVWAARPLLKDIRESAHARRARADAVLWSVLVSIAANIPARVSIETAIGVPAKPTLYAVLAGPSGSGKSISWGVARALVGGVKALPLATGEGMVESFYDEVPVEQPQPNGKDPKIVWERRRIRSNLLFYLGEGEALFKQGERSGAQIGPTLRDFWSGGELGQQNASKGLRRGIDAGSYTGGLVIGLQDDISSKLLADTGTGTAQRFAWAAVNDIYQPDERPARSLQQLDWQAPELPGTPSKIDQWAAQPGRVWTDPPEPTPVTMTLDAEIMARLDSHQVALSRREVDPDPHDAQRTAMHTKVAAVLAWTDGRLRIGAEDWQLADELLSTSDGVRDALLEHAEIVQAAERAERGVARAQVNRAEAAADGLRKRCHDRIGAVLSKAEHAVSHSELRRAVNNSQRPYVPEVLAERIAQGTVTEERTANGGRAYRLDLTAEETEG